MHAKIVTIFVSVGISLCLLSGCGKTLDSLQTQENQNTADEQVTKENTVVDEIDENENGIKKSQENVVETTQEGTSVLEFAMRDETDCEYTSVDGSEYGGPSFTAKTSYPIMSLTEDAMQDYPLLQKALIDQSIQWKKEADNSRLDMVNTQKEIIGEMDETSIRDGEILLPHDYEDIKEGSLLRAESKVLSVLTTRYCYLGGAHPYMEYATVNLDPKTGKALKLSDVITNPERLPELIQKELYKQYDGLAEGAESVEAYFQENEMVSSNYENLKWAIGYDRMVFAFSDYDLGAYATGNYVLEIPFESLGNLVNESYLEVPDSYTIPICDTLELGFGVTITPDTEYYEEYDYSENKGYTVSYGNRELYVERVYFDLEPMIVRTADGNTYLLIEVGMENDYRITQVFCLPEDENRELKELPQIDGYKGYQVVEPEILGEETEYDGDAHYLDIISTNPDHIKMYSRMNLLGTCDAYAYYKLTTKGLVQKESYYLYDIFPLVYTSKLPISADEMDKDEEKILEKNVIIPKDEDYIFYRTDGETYMDCKVSGGRIVRLKVTRSADGNEVINGENANDLFGRLWYAG